ncbi:MAG: sigma-54-dependent transcriptional regulator [Gammaproteobacteria bacterium]
MKRTVLVVDDEQNMQAVMRMVLEEAGYEVLLADSGEAALPHMQNPNLDVVLTDLKMPGMGGEALVRRCRKELPNVPVIIATAHGTISSAVRSIRDGAADYLTKPFEPEQLEIAVHNAVKLRDILRENERLKAAVATRGRRLIGTSAAANRLMDEIRQVAPYKTSVLISGESGTGKELVARTIHELSPRAEGAWIAINCSAIPRDLLESELFGYVKGAFTGATQNRSGRLEQAQGGTLFLDEIGELDPSLQAKLLRVLQEREYSPLGSDQVRAVDVRFIAASNRDLKARVAEGKFREDLFYRLDVYNIMVPPLRERREDIPLLVRAFLTELTAETNKAVAGITPAALEVLARYSWPGNIRELRNAVERAVLSCKGEHIDIGDLPPTLHHERPESPESPIFATPGSDLDGWLADVERRAIQAALARCKGVQAHAAKLLGVSERSLWHRIKKLGIQIQRVVQ